MASSVHNPISSSGEAPPAVVGERRLVAWVAGVVGWARDAVAARRPKLSLWWWRLVAVGVVAGLVSAISSQVLVVGWASDSLDTTITQRVAAMLFATCHWVMVASVLALATGWCLRWKVGRGLAVAASAFVLTALAMLGGIGAGVRVLSGSFLSLGALQFMFGSGVDMGHAAVGEYRGWALVLATSTVVLGALFTSALWSVARRGASPIPRAFVVLAVGLGLLLPAGFACRGSVSFIRGMFNSDPLLAFLASLDPGSRLAFGGAVGGCGGAGELAVPAGPPRVAGATWQSALRRSKEGDRPNLLLTVIESLPSGHVGYAGYERNVTPELDRLARDGVRMHRAWVAATHSNYAQMALLSSLFPHRRTGLDQYERLDYPRVLPHDVFHLLGYSTATISSQDENWQGMRRFQRTETPTFFWHSQDYLGDHLDLGTERTVPDHKTVDRAIAWLNEQQGQSWSLYMNFQATHFPYGIPESVPQPYQPAEPTSSKFTYLGYPREEVPIVINRYDNALRYVDEQIGRMRRYLEERGQLDDTLWIITGDHGELFYDHDLVTHGRTLYDAEARVPLVVHWPRRLASADRHEPVSHMDVMPTVLELFGIEAHPAYQGTSFAQADDERRQGLGIYMSIQGLRFADALVCWPYKLILDRSSNQAYLFHLERDPQERDNLLQQHPELAGRLAASLTAQLEAQLAYHRADSVERRQRFAPRLRKCPDLPGVSGARD